MRDAHVTLGLLALLGAAGCDALVGLSGTYSSGGSEGGALGGERIDGGGSGSGSSSGEATNDGGNRADAKGGADARTTGVDAPRGAETGGSKDASTTPDGMGIVLPDTGGANDACPAACSLAVPAGWTLVAFETGSAACPDGFADSAVVEPSGQGSCSCGSANVTAQPSCYAGNNATVSSMWDAFTTGQCNATGSYFPTNNGGCVTAYWGNATYVSWAALAPTAGACTSTPSATDPSMTAEHVCVPSGCSSSACTALPAGFETCLYQAGSQTCPATASHAHTIGTSAMTNCTDCSCSVTATSCTGVINVYNSASSCAGTPYTSFQTNGTCYAQSGVIPQASYTYTGTAQGVSASVGTSTPNLQLEGAGTVCCP